MTATAALDLEAVTIQLETVGHAVIPGVLSEEESDKLVQILWDSSAESERRGLPSHVPGLDPNPSNVRVFNLVDLDPAFGELLAHPTADSVVSTYLGDDYIVSNFSANIARPGSRSMAFHSDQALVAPEPWTSPWSMNLIWCLCDLRLENGATLQVPGSHRFERRSDMPATIEQDLAPITAPRGSVVAMDGRLWHTSGANTTEDEDRPLLFAYYSKPFVRSQWNFTAALRRDVKQRMSPDMRYRLGLDYTQNRREL
jgi:hypothetical protein